MQLSPATPRLRPCLRRRTVGVCVCGCVRVCADGRVLPLRLVTPL